MKKLLTILMLVIVTGINAQVLHKEYSIYQKYDSITNTYTKEHPIAIMSTVDIDKMHFVIMDVNRSKILYRLDIRDVKLDSNRVLMYCINSHTQQKWEVIIKTEGKYHYLKGSSNNEKWIYKEPIEELLKKH